MNFMRNPGPPSLATSDLRPTVIPAGRSIRGRVMDAMSHQPDGGVSPFLDRARQDKLGDLVAVSGPAMSLPWRAHLARSPAAEKDSIGLSMSCHSSATAHA